MGSASEMLWTLLSLLSFPLDQQVFLLGAFDENDIKKNVLKSPALQLLNALQGRQYSWVDDFDFLWDSEKQDYSRIQQAFSESLDAVSDQCCRSERLYRESAAWIHVRQVGVGLLKMSALPIIQIDQPLDFERDFLEFVYDEVGDLVGFNG